MSQRAVRLLPWAGWAVLGLGLLLAVRNMSDLAAGTSFLGPLRLNLSSVLGLLAIGWAVALVAPTVAAGRWRTVHGLRVSGLLVAYLTVWLGVGILVHGAHASLIREWVRFMSVIAVGLVVANLRSVSASRIAAAILLSMVIPTLVAIVQLSMNLSSIGAQGSSDFFRATGYLRAGEQGGPIVRSGSRHRRLGRPREPAYATPRRPR